MPKHPSPHTWLAHHPLQPSEHLFVILGSASDAKPLDAWRTMAAGTLPQPIWAGTAYAEWDEVMPYVGIVAPDSAFLDWIATTDATDWGWLAVSSSPLETVLAHLKGLTKVRLPDAQEVFLRFWDGTHFLPIVQGLGDEAGKILPVFRRYWINGQNLEVTTGPVTAAKTSPWWQVPAPLLKRLGEQSPDILIDNLLQWLEEERPDLHAAFAANTLRHKVGYFVRRPFAGQQALVDYLQADLA